jgi:RHS repeat-associated protein
MIASDTPILQQNPGTWYYHINDHLGTCRVVIDHLGQVIRAQDYFPFGLTLRSLNNQKTRFSYTGKELDTAGALGWFYFGARFYDPGIGRFLSIDPLADKYLGWSPYVYSLNNPTKYTDPDGKAVIDYNKGTKKQYEKYWKEIGNKLQKYTPKTFDQISSVCNIISYVDKKFILPATALKIFAERMKIGNPYYNNLDILGDRVNIIISFHNPITGELLDIFIDNSGEFKNVFIKEKESEKNNSNIKVKEKIEIKNQFGNEGTPNRNK